MVAVGPTAWLDGKHTIFGRIASGMQVLPSSSRIPDTPSIALALARVGCESGEAGLSLVSCC